MPFAYVIRPELPAGEKVVPVRMIGDTKADEPVQFPAKWAPHIEAVMRRRGDAPIRLYADGIFDVFHYGHMRALEQAKKSFPNTYLMVGCCNDELTHKYKGQTVMTDLERYESLRGCKWVDEVIPDAPWVITDDFLAKHDIDFVCHDALPYVDTSGQSATGDVYAHLRDIGKFHETQRTDGVSTSDLIIRIVKRYDDFVRRNLARGYTAKDMNVPFYKEATLQLEMALEKQAAVATAQIQRLSDVAEDAHHEFLKLFSREGPIRSTIRDLRGGLTSLLGIRSPGISDATTDTFKPNDLAVPSTSDDGGAEAHDDVPPASAGRRRRRSDASDDGHSATSSAGDAESMSSQGRKRGRSAAKSPK